MKMINASNYFARQPILDRDQEIVGYEFFYRNAEGESVISDPRSATASVLVNLVNQMGLHNSAADAKLFINIDTAILPSDILLSLPPERFVFEIPATSTITTKERELLAYLYDKGYRFAIDNATTNDGYLQEFTTVMPFISYVKFDTTATDIEALPQILPHFTGKKLIAQRVEIPEVFEAYRDMGFDCFQGYFFANLHLISHNRVDPKHMGVIRIYNMLISDTPMEQIAREFRHHNELSLQFLQYLNSIGHRTATPTGSMEELLQTIDPKQLEQWLMMIIYSKSGRTVATEKSPYSLMIEQCIDIMNTLIIALNPLNKETLHDQARLCAFISMMESVFNVPMAALLKQIHVHPQVEEALLAHSGTLGRIFALALAVEKEDAAGAQVLLRALKLPKELLERLYSLKRI